MLAKNHSTQVSNKAMQASIFAALGDETRLSLIAKLEQEQPCSISQLTDHSHLTRQAITKHLRVLQNAGLVRSKSKGRETLFELEFSSIQKAREYLELISAKWDETLSRLRHFVE